MTFFNSVHGLELIQAHAIFEAPTVFTAMGAEYVTQLTHDCQAQWLPMPDMSSSKILPETSVLWLVSWA
jgi:hypothetical protein